MMYKTLLSNKIQFITLGECSPSKIVFTLMFALMWNLARDVFQRRVHDLAILKEK